MENNREGTRPVLSSPFGAAFTTPELETVGYCAMGLKYAVDVEAMKDAIANSVMLQHPLFTSLLVEDRPGGRPSWKKLPAVNLEDHIICHEYDFSLSNNEEETDKAVNDFLAELAVSCPMSREKPLWEFHVLLGLNWVVLRCHHVVGDGVSMMSMLEACFEKKGGDSNKDDGGDHVVLQVKESKDSVVKKRQWRERGVKGWVKSMWYTFVFILRSLFTLMWLKDHRTVISGGDGVELWPRKLVTAKFKLEDMKKIKQEIPQATINDVFMGITSRGLSKYINLYAPEDLKKNLRVSSVFMVNVRADEPVIQESSSLMKSTFWSGWGNKIGVFLVPVYVTNTDHVHPLEHVKRMKSILDQKKQSYEADIVYVFFRLATSLFGVKAGSWILRRFLKHTTIINSNVRGPREVIEIAGNPVVCMRANISSLSHAIVMHMITYAGRVELQALVTKDIIHYPESLANCFEESLIEMTNSISTI